MTGEFDDMKRMTCEGSVELRKAHGVPILDFDSCERTRSVTVFNSDIAYRKRH